MSIYLSLHCPLKAPCFGRTKTQVFGLTGHAPQFAMLMIGANMGVVGMTRGTEEMLG